ncbi:histidine kinase [Dactylosporangium sp. NBC_01737]|uniref:sensor histidine kinase n=1 Tax=Dactylosporangium sp. NBC_01737 TaxID=2975959 RepID=UPI002E138E2B|nr:histidine kinase [Dactylosporangium sp. NBC_01737]
MSALLFALLVPEPAGDPRSARRDRLADAVAVGLAVCYGALMVSLGDATKPGAAIPWQLDVAIGTLCVLALLGRRRRPLGVALVLLPFGAVSVMATGAITVALFTVAIRHRATVVLWLGAANLATSAGYFLLQDDPPFPLWVDLLVRGVVTAAAIGWGLFVQAHRRLTQSLRDHAARLEAEQHLRVEQARLTERTRIAREMHDVLAHRLSLISLHAGALEVRTDASAEETAVAAGAIRTGAHEALQELRTVFGVLRNGAGSRPEPPQPGLGDLPELLGTARASGMTVGYTCRVPPDGPAVMLGRTVYRFVQEGLTNARKHAPGSAVQVLLDGAPGGELRVTITNPCAGTDGHAAIPGAGLGLIGLRERIALAGGRVEHGADGGTFRLQAWLPWPA